MNHLHSNIILSVTASVAGITAMMTSPATVSSVTPTTSAQALMAQCIEFANVSAIFAPGTDPKIVEMVSRAIQNQENSGNSRYNLLNRWPGTIGTPVNLTYSFPADGVQVPNGIGEGSGFNTLHANLVTHFGSVAAGKAIFAEAFAKWSAINGNTYTEVSDDNLLMFSGSGPLNGGSGRGDIRIVMKSIDGVGGIGAYNFFPGPNSGGDMVIDQAENWGVKFDNFRFFRNAIAHENGHGQGILHVCPIQQNKLMEPFLTSAFDGPQHDDVRASTNLYGDRYEPNGATVDAAFIGFFAADGSFSDTNLAMRDDSDDDYFSIDVDGAAHINVTVDPFGFSYLSGPQVGLCDTGTLIDTLNLLDLAITIFDTDGTTVLASSNAAGLGVVETLTDVALPSAGTYYVRIDGVGAIDASDQIYDLNIDVTIDPAAGCVADINGDGIVDTADLGILLGNFGGSGPAGDLNGDNIVDTADLGILLGVFGTCSTL